MAEIERPTSPHLQIYRPQLTSVLSIGHRITGVFLILGSVGLTVWLITLAASEAAFASFEAIRRSIGGQVFCVASLFSLYYHLANGVRHLAWDMGWGFDMGHTYQSGYAAVGFACVMTVVVLI
jgi:succinate dehydrogenase / fumarate reductase cytochrome b subunit